MTINMLDRDDIGKGHWTVQDAWLRCIYHSLDAVACICSRWHKHLQHIRVFEHLLLQGWSKKVVVSLPMTAPKFFLAMMRAACWLGVSSSALASSMADHPCCAMFTMCCRVSGSFTKPIRPSLPRTLKGSKRLSSPMRNFDRRLSTTFSHKKTLPPKFEKNSWHERSQPFTLSRYLAPCHICKQRWHIHR